MKRLSTIGVALLSLAFYAICYVCFLAGIADLGEWTLTLVGVGEGSHGLWYALSAVATAWRIPLFLVCGFAVIGAGSFVSYVLWVACGSSVASLETTE